MNQRKKLIEVALPLEAISDASAYEKMPGIGPHPRGVHHWWARRPLAAARTIVFASIVDDPNADTAPSGFIEACKRLAPKEHAAVEDTPRNRLLDFVADLADWKNIKDARVMSDLLKTAGELIELSTGGNLPSVLDPFAGGGAIPLEAQRLGLKAYASDLNPVAVTINKALIEIPPKFTNKPPVNPRDRGQVGGESGWSASSGLAADIRYYSEWMREKAWERVGSHYPKMNGETVIAWLWSRTVRCPNPACRAEMPLISTFWLSKKRNNRTWIEPVINRKNKTVRFQIRSGKGKPLSPPKVGRGASFRCLVCEQVAEKQYVKDESIANRMGAQMTAIVTDGSNGRNYYAPNDNQIRMANSAVPRWEPHIEMNRDTKDLVSGRGYGIYFWSDLFTKRQLAVMSTLSEILEDVQIEISRDATATGISAYQNSTSGISYANALRVFLALAFDRTLDFNNSMTRWVPTNEKVMNLFARQAIPMVWDYSEANTLANVVGGWTTCAHYVADCVQTLTASVKGEALQADAAQPRQLAANLVISTDPPYYDNISYADLSDFFYVWLRRNIRDIYPDLFSTMLVPKSAELVASSYRFGGDATLANEHFETGIEQVFSQLATKIDSTYPITIYYAFKQEEINVQDNAVSSTGWETMLSGLVRAGLAIYGTWPLRSEQKHRLISHGTNALASSIVLVCRPRPQNSPITSRRDFVNELKRELPVAFREMQTGNIAPVDLAQASIGPGMAVYSRYSHVLEANGEPLSVRTALQIINQVLDEHLAEQEGALDADSRFAVDWFTQYAYGSAEFGVADVLARAKNTSVSGLVNAGLLESGAGKVRLLRWDELDPGWDPTTDQRLTIWEATHHLIERLHTHGEAGAAMLLSKMPAALAAESRNLAYRLYSICERKNWSEDARDYNALVISWSASQEQAATLRQNYQQSSLFS